MKQLPNILIIMADQQRYDCIGSSGMRPVQTPHLDRLASEGTRFTHAFSHIPLCGPARQSFMNGRRAETFGGLWNEGIALPVGSLSPNEYVWPRELKAQGYVSHYLGKWGVSAAHDPTAYGYDAYTSEGDYARFRKGRFPEVEYRAGYFGEPDPVPLASSRTHWFADRAAEAIRGWAQAGQSWHMRLNFTEPHLPNRPAGRFATMYDPADIEPWAGFADTFANKPYIQRQMQASWGVEHYGWDDWAQVVARYYGVVSQADEAIGRVLAALEETGEAGETIVVYSADHGDMCGSHGMMDKHCVMYDDIVRVPLIVRWPGRVSAGAVSDAFVYNLLDVPPTLLDWLGCAAPETLHGRSLRPLLEANASGAGGQPASDGEWRDAVVASYNGQQFGLYTQRMIRTREWKYVWNTADVDELYRLDVDPGELTNAIGDPAHAEIVRELRRRLYDVLRQDGDALVGNEWMRRQLLEGKIVS
ncbi:MAG: sulfatase-like hydrolase/transferase [Paenibacillaceae bacterium]|nr:sulfatase-like hydrolase/transferase [Paenibacillaceae bacterium]